VKTTLGFLTEEGRTRSKNAARRIGAYLVVMLLIAGAGAYAIHRYWVASSLTSLQRLYFKQYLKSTFRSFLPRSKSHYTTLARVVRDPRTGRDVSLAVRDEELSLSLMKPVVSSSTNDTIQSFCSSLESSTNNMRGRRPLRRTQLLTNGFATRFMTDKASPACGVLHGLADF
jgi:hypothetical protein